MASIGEDDNAFRCLKCGARIPPKVVSCPKCGVRIGARLVVEPTSRPQAVPAAEPSAAEPTVAESPAADPPVAPAAARPCVGGLARAGFIAGALLGLVGLLLLLFSSKGGGNAVEAPNPPIAVAFRGSWNPFSSGDYVMQISNLAADRGFMIKIYRDEVKGYVGGLMNLPPAASEKEFGSVQIGDNFKPGQSGYVRVEGFDKVLCFQINYNESFSSDFKLLPE